MHVLHHHSQEYLKHSFLVYRPLCASSCAFSKIDMNTYFYFQARLCSQYKSVIFYVQLSSMMSISLFLMIFFNLKFMPLQSDILASESDLFYKISVTCFSASQVDFCFFDTKYLQHIFVIL